MRIINLVILIILSFGTFANAQEISPWLFGQNYWMAEGDEGDRPGFLNQLWPKVEESGVKMVRIGGIGYENDFPNREQLTAMIDSIRGIGAEPLLQIPRHFTQQEASDLVEDFEYNKGEGIRYYSIGNEPICNNSGKIDEVYKYLRRLTPAMKATDPSIKIFVFDACTFYENEYAALIGGRLDLTGKDENGHWMVDGFSFHNYPNGEDYDREDVVFSGPYSIRQQAKKLVTMLEKANKKHGRTGEDKLRWGLTETNVTYINPNREISGIGNPSFLGGQFIAEIYGIGLEYGAFTVDPWCINETDRVRTDFGYIGLPSEFYPRSSYYHTQMMATNMKGEFLPSSTNNSYVASIATISDDQIVVMILNKDKNKDYEFDLILNSEGISPKPLSVNAEAALETTISGTIPNQTTMMYIFSKSGEIEKIYTYGINHNLQHLPPDVKNM